MEREDKKRSRQEEEKNNPVRSSKKQEIFSSFDDYDIFKKTNSFQPLEVFDFPWLKENKINETDDWKLDDIFPSSLFDTTLSTGIEFSKEELCATPVFVEFPGEKLESGESGLSDDDKFDGYDCIWSSVLNQPLFSGSSKIINL